MIVQGLGYMGHKDLERGTAGLGRTSAESGENDVPALDRALLARVVSRAQRLCGVLRAPVASDTCGTGVVDQKGGVRAEKHEEGGPRHVKKTRKNALFSNANLKALPALPADAIRIVRKVASWRTLLLPFAPVRGSIIPSGNQSQKDRRPSRNATVAHRSAAPVADGTAA